ncbi:granule-bound starch synthase 1, chloroplastic/amyloplastic [Impatiens glandulifera]|uniref:granule-bound starch synthase 1, chloroplastic/amyloplastic n=1 Tax=Impatiens glandulifera TaxID=253017 RepID=UPI001FB0F2C7|nr:granule-bound starch synthase 1, chloroplastic/amyloplastic [Impatiens glandulifera]
MATVTASHFVSRSSYVNNGVETRASSTQIGMKSQMMTYNGLRSLNKCEILQIRKNLKANSKHLIRRSHKNTAVGKIVCEHPMSVVFVAAEVGPWSKTGGLGDVVGGLPPALAALGHRVMTVSPRYDQYKDAWDTSVLLEIQVGDKVETVRFFHCYKRGVDRVFVDHPIFLEKVLGKTGSKLYGPNAGTDYVDNQLKFSLLCQAALEAPRILNLNNNKYFSGPYGEDVVFVANDWHTSLIPCYLKSIYQSKGIYINAKVAFCIHNIAYQGRFAFTDFNYLNLPDEFKVYFDFIDGYEKPVKGRKINWIKAGILLSDIVVTVSEYYAKELISGEDRGVELNNVIQLVELIGIANGMDVQEWNPSTDKHIAVKYDIDTVTEAKGLLKEALQAEVGLTVDRNIPLIGFIGRLEEQKGSDILAEAIPEIVVENDVQIVILGTGKKSFEKQLEQLEIKYPDKARGIAKFNVPLAHMITAGADFMLVPSRFEPCGLIQLHAMRYGTVPIVASTGGLVDTVKDGFTGFQMGEAFNVDCETIDPVDVAAVVKSVSRALSTYGTPALTEMIRNCMSQDLSWKGPAKKWEQVLLRLGVAGSEQDTDGEEIAPLAKENVATP